MLRRQRRSVGVKPSTENGIFECEQSQTTTYMYEIKVCKERGNLVVSTSRLHNL